MKQQLEQTVRNYLRAMEQGVTGESLAAFFTEDIVQVEMPNRLVPFGKSHDLASILLAAERGQRAVKDQRFEVIDLICGENRVALQLVWTATLCVPLGGLSVGDTLKANYALFLSFREGKIASMTNYDCFSPFEKKDH